MKPKTGKCAVAILLLLLSAGCRKSTPALSLNVAPQTGNSPLAVTLTATCATCVTYVWDFGDGTHNTVPGAVQTHTYTAPGEFDAAVAASDAAGHPAHADLIIKVTQGLAGNEYCNSQNVWIGEKMDGPAQLPQRCFYTALDGTPSPGGAVTVGAGDPGNFQAAYNGAQCGQTIYVPKGSVWGKPAGVINLKPKVCDDQHWITIRTTGNMPPEGTRVGPDLAPEMFRINIYSSSAMIVGDHIRFIGMEMAQGDNRSLVSMVTVDNVSKVIFDRVYMHGTPGLEARRGVGILNAATYVAVIDSYLSEFHCIALTGGCIDSQAISGGYGKMVPQAGAWKIVNNFLEAGAENILFGGANGDGCPSDIEIRRNHLYKPMSWNPNDPSYKKPEYVVKNNFELKTGCRILFEGNVMENNWGGFSQVGWAVLVGPKNQTGNLCPLCTITDVTMRYSTVSHAGAGLSIFSGPADDGHYAAGAGRQSYHDLVIDDLQYPTCYGCGVNSIDMITSYYSTTNAPPSSEILHDVTVDHVTEIANSFLANGRFQQHSVLLLAGPPKGNPTNTVQIKNIKFTNSVVAGGQTGTYTTGGTPANNCATIKGTTKPIDELTACWIDQSLFSANVIVGYQGVVLPSTSWPPGNVTITDWPLVGFVNYNNGNGGDYHLAPTSVFKGKALDGRDPGADIDAVTRYTQNVRSPQ